MIGCPTACISAAHRLVGDVPAPRPRCSGRPLIATIDAAATASRPGVRLLTLTTSVPSSMVVVDTASAPSRLNVSSIVSPPIDVPARWSYAHTAP